MIKKEEKDVVLNKKINVESFVSEKDKKAFTEKGKNNIIINKHSPLNKDYRLFEREGLYVNETKDILLDELLEELNIIERIFFKRKFIKLYNKARIKIVNTMLK